MQWMLSNLYVYGHLFYISRSGGPLSYREDRSWGRLHFASWEEELLTGSWEAFLLPVGPVQQLLSLILC